MGKKDATHLMRCLFSKQVKGIIGKIRDIYEANTATRCFYRELDLGPFFVLVSKSHDLWSILRLADLKWWCHPFSTFSPFPNHSYFRLLTLPAKYFQALPSESTQKSSGKGSIYTWKRLSFKAERIIVSVDAERIRIALVPWNRGPSCNSIDRKSVV